MTSHAHVTFEEFGLHTPELAALGNEPHRAHLPARLPGDRRHGRRQAADDLFSCISSRWARRATGSTAARRRCRSASPRRRRCAASSRSASARTMPPTSAGRSAATSTTIAQRVSIAGDDVAGYSFEPVDEAQSCLDVLLADGFCENVVERRPELDRWTLYHTRGPAGAASVPARLHPVVAGAGAHERHGRARHRPQRPALAHDLSARAGGRALSARRLGPAEGVGPLPGGITLDMA